MGNLKITYFVSLIFLLLACVPIGIYLDNILVAKLSGILCLLVLLVALKFWFSRLRLNSKKKPIVHLNINDNHFLEKKFPFLSRWTKEEKGILRNRIGSVLAEVQLVLDNKDMEREEALFYAFFIGILYVDVDFLPLSGRIITFSSNKLDANVGIFEKEIPNLENCTAFSEVVRNIKSSDFAHKIDILVSG